MAGDATETFGKGGLNRMVDARSLVDGIGLDGDEIAWRKEFIGFDDEDERRLTELTGLFRENRQEIADRFYENLTPYERTMAVIRRSPKGVEQLKKTQQAYLVTLATGSYDREYFTNRARIGKLHHLLEMPLNYYIGQYGVYYGLLFEKLDDRIQRRVVSAIEEWADEQTDDATGRGGIAGALGVLRSGDRDEDVSLTDSLESTVREEIHRGLWDVLSVLRILNLDMQVAADTYNHAYNERLEGEVERRRRLATEVERDVRVPLEELDEVSTQVAHSAQGISDDAVTATDNLASVAEEVSEVAASIEEIAATAQQVDDRSRDAERKARAGRQSNREALDAVTGIRDQAEAVSEDVEGLNREVEEIDAVLDDLDGLARRVDVVANDATTKAAQSDTDGIVEALSEQVQSFAATTRDQITEIESRMNGLRTSIAVSTTRVETAFDRLDTGIERVEASMQDMDEIHAAVEETSHGMQEIATATDRTAESADAMGTMVTEAIGSADNVAQEIQDVAAANEELTAQTEEIATAVKRLTEAEAERSADLPSSGSDVHSR